MSLFKETRRLQDWIALLSAGCLFVSPWLLGFAAEATPAWNAWISGAAIAALAVIALATEVDWEDWLSLVLGVWVAAAPWILGFAAITHALWAHLVLGLALVAIAAWALWETRRHSRAAA